MIERELAKIEIENEDKLLRGVHPQFIKETGKISSGVFRQRDPHLSVDAEKLTTFEIFFRKHPVSVEIARIITGYVRQLNLEVFHEPLVDNPAHTIIDGTITKTIARKLAASAEKIPCNHY